MTSSAKARQGVTDRLRSMVVEVVKTLHVPRLVYGVVSAVHSPSSLAANATCSVTLQGTSTVIAGVKYPTNINPIVGDTVVCARVGTDLFLLTKLATAQTPWVTFGSAGAVTIGAGFSAGPTTTPQYRKLGDRVELRGEVQTAAGSGANAALTGAFPAGFVPPVAANLIALTSAGTAQLFITSGGLVLTCALAQPAGGVVLLDNLGWNV